MLSCTVLGCMYPLHWHVQVWAGWQAQSDSLYCTARSSSRCQDQVAGTLFGGTLYATAGDTDTVPTPSLNYHDHTQHASFSCWLLDALVKSPLA